MSKAKSATALMFLGLLSIIGCDAENTTFIDEPTLVFGAGYEIDVSGENIPIQGFDVCPSQNELMTKVFGPAPQEGKQTCVVLSKERQKVSVQINMSSGSVVEDWEVIREVGKSKGGIVYQKTRLRRPDGTFVVPVL